MLIRTLLFAAVLVLASAKINLPKPKHIQIESLTPFDAPLDVNGEPISFAGAVVVDGVSQTNHLDMNCNNKFCTMMLFAASCKAIGLGVRKICARYLLGYKYGCDEFPAPTEVVNAPSICIPSVLRILPVLNGTNGLQKLLGPYLNATDYATDTCGRKCFQHYQNATHDFYANCRSQLNATYVPLATAISNFQEYRNQACSENEAGSNCFAAISGLLPSPSSETTPLSAFMSVETAEALLADAHREATEAQALAEGASTESVTAAAETSEFDATTMVNAVSRADLNTLASVGASLNIFNFTCDYGFGYATNQVVKQQICMKLSSYGCCAATGISMLAQNPIGGLQAAASGGTVDPTIFPPCLTKYLKDGPCGPLGNVDLQNYCSNGSIASTTVVTGTLFMPKYATPPPGVYPFPNVYSKSAVLNLQGAVTAGLSYFQGFTAYPYLFNKKQPLQVQIVDYTYYGAGKVPLTPSDGGQYQPYGGDYTAAVAGNFTYQVVVQDLNATGAAVLYAALRAPQFQGVLNQAYTGSPTGNPPAAYVLTKTAMYPAGFGPNPLEVGAAFSLKGSQWLVSLLLTVGVSAALLVSSSSSGSRRGSELDRR